MTHFSYPTNRDGRSYGENNDHHEETITIVPVQSVSDKEGERSALTSKASTLVGELNNLRSNIDMMADELQSLLATERAAVEQAELLNVMTSRIRESLNFDHILNVAVKDARNALDADRVLVFAFDPSDWSGKVVAEAVERRWSSALGMELHDPCFAERYASLYEKGRIHAVDNIDEADLGACYVDQLRGLDVKSNLVAPLILGDRLYGLLVAHQCAVSRQWSDSVIEFFRQLAIQVGYALDQASLLNQQRAAAEQAKRLNQINLRVRESLKAEDIFNAAVQETYTALNADRVIFYQLNSEGQGQVIAEEVRRQFPATIGSDLADPFFDAHHREAHLRGQVSAIEDIYDAGLDDATLNQLKLKSIRASLIAPVIAQQNLVGFLVAHQCAVARQWTSLESELLSKVAIQVGYALDQAYALEQQENAALQAQILNEIASRLGTSQDVTEILENAVEDAREVFRADRVLVFQVDQQLKGKAITESADPRWQSLVGKSLQDCGLDERYVKQAQRGRLTILNHPSDAGLSDFQLDRLTDAQVRSLMIAPVVIEKDLFGILVIHSCRQQRLWQEVDSNLLKQISNQISFALERVSLIEQRRMTAERYQRLNDISGRLQESLDISEILNVTVDETRDLLNADRVIVYKFDPEWRGLINAESVVSGYSSILGLETNEPRVTEKFAKAYLRGKITSYENIYEAQFQDCHIKEFASHEVKGYMAIAITTNQKLYGLLIVHQCSAPRQWTEVETNLLKQIAQQTGYSLEQALLREERQRAERLNKVRIRLQETSEVGSLLNVAVEEVRDILGVDRAIVYQFDSSWKGLITAESQAQGYPSTLGLRTNEPRVTEKFAKEYLKGKVTAYSDIYNADFVDCHIGEFAPYEVKSYMAVGIIANQQLYGMLIVHQCSNIRSWNELELDNLKLVAEQVGYALDQALLRQAQEEAIDRTPQVNLISFRIRESLDIERIFRTGVEEALNLMQCDRVVVYRFDDNWDGRIKFEAVKSG